VQTTTQRWVPSLIMSAVTMFALVPIVKQAALFLWIAAMLSMSLALILALQQQPRSWWVVLSVLTSFILGFSVIWWIVQNTSQNI
jgi:hypothetical protein